LNNNNKPSNEAEAIYVESNLSVKEAQ